MMAEMAVRYKEMTVQRILAELYRGIVSKSSYSTDNHIQCETYDSTEVDQILVDGKLTELQIRPAFNDHLVLQQNLKNGHTVIYIPLEWKGVVITDRIPKKLTIDDRLKESPVHIVYCEER